ncbi:MAG: xanthine dehydrogenase family protein molybdopterin-binding subunit [Alphaproteobacteria bacterium]|nr:xanthine dehydrogenase family protein molybdopterin-binding subunit [Alphaproteobacteria bacterium]
MTNVALGQSLARFEDHRFLTGEGRYTADIDLDGQLHGVVLRSPYAHAAIGGIDTAAAAEQPGVAAVYTAAALRADGIGAMPCVATVATVDPIIVPPRYALAAERVRHVGDPVAFVVAESRQAALDAAELIEVDYDDLPAVTEGVQALAPGAPELWPEAPGNVAYRFLKGDRDAVEKAFAEAAHVVERDIVNQRIAAVPLEPRAAIGSHDSGTDTLRLTVTGQGVHGIRNQLAKAVFKLPNERIEVVAPDVGGGFGLKNFVYPEWVLVLWAARHLGRPVKWVAERGEEFQSGTHGRDIRTKARLALDADGKFLALAAEMTANMGAYLSSNGPGSSTNSASTAMGGVYVVPEVYMDVRGAFTNTVPVDAYRGAGKPEANYIIERLIEAAARQTGIDPVALRLANVIDAFPYRSALGIEIDSGGFKANIETAVAEADRAGFEARRQAAAKNGRLRGVGVACFLETSRGAPEEGAEVRFLTDGTVELLLGTESNGQGHETTFPQIASARLGLPIDAFRYVQADTSRVRGGHGHGGARSMHMGGGALSKAMDAVLEKARHVAAQLLQAEAMALDFAEGGFAVSGSERSVSLLEVAAAARNPEMSPDGSGTGLDSFAKVEGAPFTFPSGCHVAEVEVDPETGGIEIKRYLIVDDYGRLINPRLTEGQVLGGVTQGIGQAAGEAIAYDPDSGQLLSGSTMDYRMPRADDLPTFEVRLEERPTEVTPLGVKGSGQAGCIAAPQTIMSAVLDALAPLGIDDLDMPATPERIWRAIQDAKGA